MNIQQLEYIVAVDEHRHFQKAAESCFITPATLSMMIKKLEQELNLIIFDRSKQPIKATEAGSLIIEKAKLILYHIKDLQDSAKFVSDEIAGEVRIAVIPTLAPYLVHLFVPVLVKKYPMLKIKLFEWNTDQIIEALVHNRLDIGIAATPLDRADIKETHLFYERLLAYSVEEESKNQKEYIVPSDINLDRLWLLEEDHCLRSQVLNLCALKKRKSQNLPIDFEAGSIETLLNMVAINKGVTIIPELVVHTLSEVRKKFVSSFVEPMPVREISLLTYRYYLKDKLVSVIQHLIQEVVSKYIGETPMKKNIISIDHSIMLDKH